MGDPLRARLRHLTTNQGISSRKLQPVEANPTVLYEVVNSVVLRKRPPNTPSESPD